MDAAIFHGALPFVMDPVAVSRGGRGVLDSFRARLLCTANWEADSETLGFEVDKRVEGYGSLWVKSMVPEYEAEQVVVVDVSGEGVYTGGERRQRKMKCGDHETSVGPHEKIVIVWVKDETGKDPETNTELTKVPRRQTKLDGAGEPVLKDLVTPSGSGKRWVISEAEVALLDTYFTTSKPVMNTVGQPFAPINPPEVPPYQWSGYSEPMRLRHPNGWVLADRDSEELFYFSDAIGLWRVTDTIVFRHPAFPD